MSSEYIIRGRVIKASTHYIIKISHDVYEKFSKFKRIKAIVSDSVNNVEFCLEFRKWSNGTHFLIPCSKKESMILHQLFHCKEVTVNCSFFKASMPSTAAIAPEGVVTYGIP